MVSLSGAHWYCRMPRDLSFVTILALPVFSSSVERTKTLSTPSSLGPRYVKNFPSGLNLGASIGERKMKKFSNDSTNKRRTKWQELHLTGICWISKEDLSRDDFFRSGGGRQVGTATSRRERDPCSGTQSAARYRSECGCRIRARHDIKSR